MLKDGYGSIIELTMTKIMSQQRTKIIWRTWPLLNFYFFFPDAALTILKGRSIHDNVIMAHEIFYSIKQKLEMGG
jgi:hypothetical protein